MSYLQGGARKVAVLAALLAGCAGAEPQAAPASEAPLTVCSEPRPQACTREYRPVCGHRCEAPPCAAEERRSYGNGCDACADPAVRAHTPRACEGELS